MKGVVSCVTGQKVMKASSFEPRIICQLEKQPGEALHIGESNVALRPPVLEMLEIADRHTHVDTQNTSINIIDIVVCLSVQVRKCGGSRK